MPEITVKGLLSGAENYPPYDPSTTGNGKSPLPDKYSNFLNGLINLGVDINPKTINHSNGDTTFCIPNNNIELTSIKNLAKQFGFIVSQSH
jgi:hypothetical protein